uniref:Protein LTV1 homolog n=1 Tax=Astyanax mexicanus TaxID=7994 RepID=W5K6T9_ASTMX
FHLVHRSQKDPLAADEKAPQHVLLPASKVEVEKRREEQRQFGVFFDDDYNYLQHLKEASRPAELISASQTQRNEEKCREEVMVIPAASINLPSSVFASEFEEEVGLLNKAAPVSGPRLDMDPDIVAALDEDFDFDDPENMLEDDFVIQANDVMKRNVGYVDKGEGEGDDDEWEDTDESGEEEEEEQDYDSAGAVSDEEDEFGDGGRQFAFMDCETKSRFTEYSLTSSVMRRNEQLTLLDDRFEKFYEQFDDDEIGALDNAELEGYINPDSARLDEVIQDYFRKKQKECQTLEQLGPPELPTVKEEDDEEEEMETLVIEEPPTEKWDCETIISKTNICFKNKQIRVSSKTGIPLDVLPKKGLTARQVERMERINDSDLPRVSTQPRSREESKEDRKLRKQAIKDERKERRVEKKANKVAFKQEKLMQEKQMVGLRANVQGMKLS